MASPLPSLLTVPFFLALLATLLVAATLRLLAILPNARSQRHHTHRLTSSRAQLARRRQAGARVLVVLGSGGHTHEMFELLRGLDTRKYTHRTYVVSSGDVFSALRAVEFERGLEDAERRRKGKTRSQNGDARKAGGEDGTDTASAHVGFQHYTIATIPRARHIHQSLLTTPLSCLRTLLFSFSPLLTAPSPNPNPLPTPQPPPSPSSRALPSLILTNGPATAVIVILAALLLRFFDVRGAQSTGKCRTIYAESFARVRTLSLSGKILVRLVDRFLVQWEELEGAGGRAEFWGVLVGGGAREGSE
ncbi:Alg14-domain-containing protein [Pyrenochaeta sp. DS3sAY3a]|nr:Alg14-domain-containing protein [Pyrenochaeta sp. DS3sAY3a]